MFFWRLFRPLVAALLLGSLFNTAQAQNSTPSQRVVAGCVGYGTGLADDISGAGRNTPAWDNVFRPAREECLRRGGPESMPNGSMFAPFYSSGGNGNDTPKGGYRLTSAEFNQGRTVLGACRVYGFRQADPVAARASNAWFNAFSIALRTCLNHVGSRPDGSALLSPPLPKRNGGLALAVAYGLGDEFQSTCPTDECITVAGTAIPIDLLRWIANTPLPGGTGVSNGTGGTDGGNGSSNPSEPDPEEKSLRQYVKGCLSKAAELGEKLGAPNLRECLNRVCTDLGLGGATQCYYWADKIALEVFPAAMIAYLVSKTAIQAQGKILDALDKAGKLLDDLVGFAKEHPVATVLGVAVIGGAIYCVAQTGGACLALLPDAVPAAGGLLVYVSNRKAPSGSRTSGVDTASAYCRSIITAELRGSKDVLPPSGIDALVSLCVSVMPGPDARQRLAAAMISKCDLAGANATRQAGTEAAETKYSRAVNQCLRLVASTIADFGRLPSEKNNFSNRMTAELRECAESAGLQWQGSETTGAAVPPPGGVRNGLGLMTSCLRAWPATVQ